MKMLTKIYFCLFCPQKFATNDENHLKNHLMSRHFDGNADRIVKQWVHSLVDYQTELNICLSSEPKSLPKSSMCQSLDNNGKQKLLKGCGLCDTIIENFKLDINLVNKQKSVCVCGGGKEVNKVVVICHLCKHLYHYPCVEPTGYSGEETSLYKCLKCKRKDFDISDLSSESPIFQPIHVSHHLNYQPIICKAVSRTADGRTVVCNESFFRQNFLKTHLKSEHKLTPNEREISKYYELHSIPKVQHLIESSLKKLCQNNTSQQSTGQSVNQTSAQSSSVQNHRESAEISDILESNKRLRTETCVQSLGSTDRSGEEPNNQYCNGVLGPPPLIEPVSPRYRNKTVSTPPQLSPAIYSRPPVLVNQSHFGGIPGCSTSSQMPKANNKERKRGRGRPKGSKGKNVGNRPKSSHSNDRKIITPNTYIADGNPQLKSRLSVESRLSRPNISLSREQEKALHSKRSKTNGNKKSTQVDSSDWDSDTEMFEIRGSSDHRVFKTTISQNSQNGRFSDDIRSQSAQSIGDKDSEMMGGSTSLSQSPVSSSQSEVQSAPSRIVLNICKRQNSATLRDIPTVASVSEPIQQMRFAAEETSAFQQTKEMEEIVLFNTDSEMSDTNNEPISDIRPVLFTEVTRVEDNQSMDSQTDNVIISSPELNVQNEEPVVNQIISHSDWLLHTKPKKFPYLPQINDEVVYIPYGHRLYIDAVRKLALYRQTNPTKYVSNEYINDILFAKVKEIKFEKHSNVRLTKLTLALIENNIETKWSFNVKFHDIDNVLDFIILKQTYDNSLMRNWKIGDSFRAIIDDKWWFGDIQSYNVTENSVKTQFQALNIVWGNGTTDILSYWDLEPIPGEVPQNKNISIDVTDVDRHLFYMSEVQEWPVYGKHEECKRIVNGLTQVMQLKENKELMEVMNPSNNDYVNRVPYLINLSIVRSRVQNMFYRRHAAIKCDIKLLQTSAKILDNGTNGVLTNAQIILAVCLRFIDEHRAKNIEHIYNKVMEDPSILSKIKFYSCTRPFLNPNPNVVNPLIVNTCAQILNFNGNDFAMNILTPSTTRPIINTIRRSNDSDISVIQLSDSEDNSDEEEEQTSEHRIQDMVNQMDDYVVSPTAPDTPPPPPVLSEEVPLISHSRSLASRPILPVKAQPIEERPPTRTEQTPDIFKRYFCIFCTKKFFDRNEAMDHYLNELKIKLKCSQCPQNLNFDSLELFLNHNSEHIKQMKPSINSKTYLNTKSWIEKMVEYMDSLLNPITAQNQIHPKFGDCCIVCQRLNVLTPDSQPFFHKSVFGNNRISMDSTVKAEVEFAQHIRQHLKYEPVYNCTLCALNKSTDVFTSSAIDENCRQHLRGSHNFELRSAEVSDVTSFFGNTKIPGIDNIIPDAVNLFIFNCLNW